jgi:cytochrome c oxidase subunit 4
MTAVAESPTTEQPTEGHGHPSDLIYWKVGGILAVLTGLEVSTYWWPKGARHIAVAVLLIMMAIKFCTVALYFMHLKFDAKILRRLFITGFILASFVYLLALSTMSFWDHSGTEKFNNPPRSHPIPPPPTEPPPSIPAGE